MVKFGINDVLIGAGIRFDARISGIVYPDAFVFIAEAVDLKFLKDKFSRELEKDRKYIEGLKAKLNNDNFIKNAPPELVAAEKEKLAEGESRTGKLESYIRDLIQ